MSDRKYKFKQTESECGMSVRKLEQIARLGAENSRARATCVVFFSFLFSKLPESAFISQHRVR